MADSTTKQHQDIYPGDKLGRALAQICAEEKPDTILDIGASSGSGSTYIFRKARPSARIFAIEMEGDRYKDLKGNFGDDKKAFLYQGSSCPSDKLMSGHELRDLMIQYPKWNAWRSVGPQEMMDWRNRQAEAVAKMKPKYKQDLIPHIKKKHKVEHFDLVMVDGGAFSGWYEVEQTHGAKIIVLDDIMDPKNYRSYKELTGGGQYWCIEVDKHHRNGYAIFKNLSA